VQGGIKTDRHKSGKRQRKKKNTDKNTMRHKTEQVK
jgi:hypothetical protein